MHNLTKLLTSSTIITIILAFFILLPTLANSFTAQTKGSIMHKYWKNKIKYYVVLVDSETIVIKNSKIRCSEGDDVILNVEINGPNSPVTSIIYVVPFDTSFKRTPSETELEENPPFFYLR